MSYRFQHLGSPYPELETRAGGSYIQVVTNRRVEHCSGVAVLKVEPSSEYELRFSYEADQCGIKAYAITGFNYFEEIELERDAVNSEAACNR